MKPAILVALLFRTLDAFRIFDTIYIFNQGAQGTESISMLNYTTLLDRLNLGLGSAVSVLLFLLVALIAFVFIKGFGAGAGAGTEADVMSPSSQADRPADGRWRSSSSRCARSVPVLWIVFLSLKTPATATDGSFIPHHWTLSNYSDIFKQGIFTDALRNSIGIGADLDRSGRGARLIRGVRDRPAGLPRQAGDPRGLAGAWRCSRRSRWSARSTTCGARSVCTTPGRG